MSWGNSSLPHSIICLGRDFARIQRVLLLAATRLFQLQDHCIFMRRRWLFTFRAFSIHFNYDVTHKDMLLLLQACPKIFSWRIIRRCSAVLSLIWNPTIGASKSWLSGPCGVLLNLVRNRTYVSCNTIRHHATVKILQSIMTSTKFGIFYFFSNRW